MVYFGKIKNGKVVLDAKRRLPEGARVRVEPVEPGKGSGTDADPAYRLWELAVDDKLPADLAAEHDHYIYGTPKRRKPTRAVRKSPGGRGK